mgnify:CR=1 FL=1
MFGLLIASLFAADAGWKYRFVRMDDSAKKIKALEQEQEALKHDSDGNDISMHNGAKIRENEILLVDLKKKNEDLK